MEEKFETLWLRYKRPIFGYLLAHARQPADAEDLLQIVAYKALRIFLACAIRLNFILGYSPSQSMWLRIITVPLFPSPSH